MSDWTPCWKKWDGECFAPGTFLWRWTKGNPTEWDLDDRVDLLCATDYQFESDVHSIYVGRQAFRRWHHWHPGEADEVLRDGDSVMLTDLAIPEPPEET
jgi:hypothetical protein